MNIEYLDRSVWLECKLVSLHKIVYSVIDRMDILSDINTEPYVLKRIGQPPRPHPCPAQYDA